ncbi:hypothetical protein L1D29_18180 [Shewanella insulae]|uniref:hypothetical protein n=1 Tax=Shewanella insulae TaxID=2681496 RepID=UPI001EFC696F|nr:hypothetical protein [Shewanella insulae]MCG9714733.1 hypothetical protein [Shewanella insulae]
MLSTSILSILLRLICLWLGFITIQKGAITLYIHELNSLAAQVSLLMSLLILAAVIVLWFLSEKVSRYIIGVENQGEVASWSSRPVISTTIILFSLYGIVIEFMPDAIDIATRSVLLLSSSQYTTLFSPSVLVPTVSLIIKGAVFVVMIIKGHWLANMLLRINGDNLNQIVVDN